MIRSIENSSDHSRNFSSDSDRKKMVESINEKMKSGTVSKEKMDNLVKAKSEHAGILKEVESLQQDPATLTKLQKAQLADLHATAETALELLKDVTP